jgi:hypothetical protein
MSKKYFALVSILLLAAAVFAFRFLFSSRTLAYGCFHQVAHQAKGCAALIATGDGRTVLRLIDFQTTAASDLHVLLIAAGDARENETVKNSERLYLAPLEKNEGTQRYLVPPGGDLTKFNAVTIWHEKHGVNFTTAPLRRF